MTLRTGDTARLIQPEIKGTVKQRKIGDDDATLVLLEFQDADGQLTQRWFEEQQLEAAQ